MQFPFVAVPDGANVLYLVDFREVNVGASLVLTEDEARPIFFEVRAFAESNPIVLRVVLEPVCFERDCGTRSFVALFTVTGRIRLLVFLLQVEP